MEDTIRAELLTEINRAARRLGAKSDLLALIGSWGDTLSDEDVLHGLRRWNDRAGPSFGRYEGISSEHAIQHEIRIALEHLGAPLDVIAPLSSWGDTYTDTETLVDIRRYNQTGSMFDSITIDLRDQGQDNEPR